MGLVNRKKNKGKIFIVVWLLIVIYTVFYSIYSVVRHLKFETYIFDLGYYDQLLWLAANGKKIFSSVIEAHPWVDHFSPSIFLLTPLYFIWENPIILLIFQVFFVCLGAYPIFNLAIKKTNNYYFSLVLTFSYLTFYGLQNAIAYDFHAVTLGSTLLAFIFWFYEEKRFKLFWLSLIIFAGLQENFLILSSALGVFIALKYKDYKRGIFIFVGFLTFAIILLTYLIPRVFGQGYYYFSKTPEISNLGTLIKTLYTPSSKIDVVTYAFTAFGLLPILSPYFFILLGEEFLGRFILTSNPNWWMLGFHYNAILAPILAFATIETFSKYFQNKYNFAIALLIIGTLISQYRVKPDIYKMFNKSFYDISNTQDAKEIIKLIPKNASIAASNNLGAQIAGREGLIFLTNCLENDKVWGPDGKRCYKLKPDYILADLDPAAWNNYYPDYNRDSLVRYLDEVQAMGEYSLVNKQGWVQLLRKNSQ